MSRISWQGALGAATGALIGGPAGAAVGFGMGSSISSAQDAEKAQREANDTNVALTRETNASAIELANTAHQREVKDLAAAGLNPILSAKYGGSATPTLANPSVTSLAPTILSSAKQTQDMATSSAGLSLQAQLQKSQVLANSAQAVKTGEEARRVAMENDVLETEAANRKYAETRRKQRSPWLKNLGIDIGDTLSTGGRFLGGLFK